MFPKKDDLEASFAPAMPPTTAYGGSTYGSVAYVSGSQGAVAYPGKSPRARVPAPPPSGWAARALFSATSAKPLLEVKGIPFTKQAFMCLGAMIVCILLIMPMFEAIKLTQNWNYVYWHGPVLPYMCIILCVMCFFGWFLLSSCAFSGKRLEMVTKSDLAIAAVTMTTLIGLVLLFVSMIGSTQSFSVRMALSSTCESNIQTRAMRTWYHEALQLRRTPDCATKHTIEDCAGFKPLSKRKHEYYYYKKLEHTFRCSGFCFQAPAPAKTVSLVSIPNASSPEIATATSPEIAKASSPEIANASSPEIAKASSPESANASSPEISRDAAEAAKVRSPSATSTSATSNYPPTLFTDVNFNKVSCQGAAALDLYFRVVSQMTQMWWLGITLIGFAVAISVVDQFGIVKLV